ncbi:Rpn family recombination-promoting nuclease/putative transposase [Laspinema sp. D1]|uniref:Rpn family recombination-promoting nuclease/putative transposase n=2 Tax=Laspinema TaxID=2584823 RepID=A0ABT2MXK0_9CYAN|nr:Rpn family recombination-promoting nuclease/putative transposase [Laspinema sp. D2a]
MNDDADRAEVVDLIQTVVFYKFSKLSREEVQEMIGVNEFKQSKLYQDIKLEGKLEVVPELLSRRFAVEQTAQILGLIVEQVRLTKSLFFLTSGIFSLGLSDRHCHSTGFPL